jgi:hypothetical protein
LGAAGDGAGGADGVGALETAVAAAPGVSSAEAQAEVSSSPARTAAVAGTREGVRTVVSSDGSAISIECLPAEYLFGSSPADLVVYTLLAETGETIMSMATRP